MMNPSPTEIVELFTFVEATLVQYATVAGRLPGVAATAVKAKPNRVNKVEIAIEEQPKEETQASVVTPRPKSKGPNWSTPPISPVKTDPKPPEPKKTGKGGGKGKKGKSEQKPEKRRQRCILFYRGTCKKGDHCNYEHKVDRDGQPICVGPKFSKKV